jgi:ferredoxin
VLGAEVLVVWTLWVAHGVRFAEGTRRPRPRSSPRSSVAARGHRPADLEWIGAVNLVVHLAIVGAFLVFTLHSKHLHILTIPFQELSRDPDRPKALGKLQTELIDLEAMDESTVLGVGQIEHLTFDRFLDLQTCTECGRCQSQCPAWTTGKPLSPKMLIMDLRDHMFAKGPYLTGQRGPEDGVDILGMMLVGDRPGRRVRSSTTTCCGRARPAARASRSARSTSSTSTPSSTCGATRR